MNKYHDVGEIQFDNNTLMLKVDGRQLRFALSELSPALANASDLERNTYEITPSGYGIHWPLLDEDLSIDGLLGIAHQRPAPSASVHKTE